MPFVFSLYVDDSGTRNPDRGDKPKPGEVNWFGLGGMLIREDDEHMVRAEHQALYKRWPQLSDAPLHSHEIRHAAGRFAFLNVDKAARAAFMDDLSAFLLGAPVLGHACVIHRPGYMARYEKRYGDKDRWLLCKTAFAVLLERAVKYVDRQGAKLRVYVERAGKREDGQIEAYYEALRTEGMPFAVGTSARYAPLAASTLRSVLYDLKFKNKSSPLMQLADLYLYPICKTAYGADRAFDALSMSGRLINSVLPASDLEQLGLKYSCFEAFVQK